MKKYKFYLPCRGYGRSLGNMLELLSGEAVKKQDGNWIEFQEKEQGVFVIANENLTVKDGDWVTENTALGFSQWDAEVKDLDNGSSDASQCFGISEHLQWKKVEMTPKWFKAHSIKMIEKALQHIAICAWCPGDI